MVEVHPYVTVFCSKSKLFKSYSKDLGTPDLTENVCLRHRLSLKGHKGCGPKTTLVQKKRGCMCVSEFPVSELDIISKWLMKGGERNINSHH